MSFSFAEHDLDAPKLIDDLQVLLRECGQMSLQMQGDCKARAKSPRDVITEADHASDALISQWVERHFPTHNRWIEESGQIDQGSDFTWLADPLDGTVNFSRGIPFWGVAIALLYRGQVILGVAYLPVLDEMYTAILGSGAWLNGQELRVASTTQLDLALVSNGDVNVGEAEQHAQLNQKITADWTAQARHCQRVKCFGSAVVEGCFVAAGRLDAYVMRLSHPWDIATVSLLVTEAGGRCSQIGQEDFVITDLCTALMTNGHLHQDLQRILDDQ